MPSPAPSRIAASAMVALAVAVAGAACGDRGERHRAERDTAAAPYVLLTDTEASGAPRGCAPTEVADRLDELFRELSSSESVQDLEGVHRSLRQRAALTDLVDRFFGGEGAPFAWLSLRDHGVEGIPTIEARSRRDLVSYLSSRPFRRLDLELTRLGPMQWVPERGNLALGLILFEVYAKQPRERIGYGTGKAEYHCATSSFVVLSLMVHEELPPWATSTFTASLGGFAPTDGMRDGRVSP